MAVTHVYTISLSRNNVQVESSEVTLSEESELNFDFALPANQTDYELSAAFDFANLKSILIVSTAAITIETNSGSAPDDTFTIGADEPFFWYDGSGIANPFTANVTALFLTNTTAADVQIYCLLSA